VQRRYDEVIVDEFQDINERRNLIGHLLGDNFSPELIPTQADNMTV
jgi:superfamily I DNA/RNA helicase